MVEFDLNKMFDQINVQFGGGGHDYFIGILYIHLEKELSGQFSFCDVSRYRWIV